MEQRFPPLLVVLALLSGFLGGMAADAPRETAAGMEEFEVGGANSSLYSQVYRNYMDSVVSVKVITPSGTSQGSGFLYDSSGHIVTNHHVISKAETVEVKFRRGEWRRARLVGKDRYSDLAVLEVKNIPDYVEPLEVAEKNPDPGQRVMALGNPFGLQATITHGIVSGVNRTMRTKGGFRIPDTVQTDAPINPGNSGGPLITPSGKVVGVNRAKKGDNIGFAISPSIIKRVVPSLIEKGFYRHPYLGVSLETVSPRVAEANGVSTSRGVIVVETVEGGPADGVLKESRWQVITGAGRIPVGGDIITRIEGRRIEDTQELLSYIATRKSPGDVVTLTVLRDGERRRLRVQLEARPGTGYQSPFPTGFGG